MLEVLQSVQEELCECSPHPLDYTKETKTIKTVVTTEGADSNIQWDTFECTTIILASIMKTNDNYHSYHRDVFDTWALHIKKMPQL